MAHVHETNNKDVIPARPTLEEARNDTAVLIILLQGWADACDMRHRIWKHQKRV